MRINLYSGAGAGKSVLASQIYSNLSIKGYDIQLVSEYIKTWAYQKRVPRSFDQCYIFGKQLHAEDALLQSGVQHLVTDSPLGLQIFYAKFYKFPCWESLLEIANTFDALHPSFNIFLDRTGIPYKTEGRYESEELAKEIDKELRQFMDASIGDYVICRSRDIDGVIDALGFIPAK